MKNLKYVPGLLLILFVSGCATLSEPECEQADWKIIGIEDGSKGRPLSYLGQHRKACAEYGIKPDLVQYKSGHNVGLRQYCTPQNGYRQGRAGRRYENVCPFELENSFLAAYETGQKLYRLSSDIDHMLGQVHDMEHSLEDLKQRQEAVEASLVSDSLSSVDRKKLLDEFKLFQSGITVLENDIRDTELEAARMQGEFDLLNDSHGY